MHWTRRHRRGRPPHPDVLTPAEWRVLEHVREGIPNAEIAVRLGITVRTVKAHVTSILAKTDMPDRHALARWDGQPSEAYPGELRGGFALPFTGGGVLTGAKLAAGGVVAVVLVAGLFAVYTFFFGEAPRDAASPVADRGEGAFVELLRLMPDREDVRLGVSMGDVKRAREALGVDVPPPEVDGEFNVEGLMEYVGALHPPGNASSSDLARSFASSSPGSERPTWGSLPR